MRETAAKHSCPLFLFVSMLLIVKRSQTLALQLAALTVWHAQNVNARSALCIKDRLFKQAAGFLEPEQGEFSEQWPDASRTFSQSIAKFYCMAERLKLVQISRIPHAGLYLMSQCSTSSLLLSLRTSMTVQT